MVIPEHEGERQQPASTPRGRADADAPVRPFSLASWEESQHISANNTHRTAYLSLGLGLLLGRESHGVPGKFAGDEGVLSRYRRVRVTYVFFGAMWSRVGEGPSPYTHAFGGIGRPVRDGLRGPLHSPTDSPSRPSPSPSGETFARGDRVVRHKPLAAAVSRTHSASRCFEGGPSGSPARRAKEGSGASGPCPAVETRRAPRRRTGWTSVTSSGATSPARWTASAG